MAYYLCSPTAGLTVPEPRMPGSFEKSARIYLTTLLPMALMYTIPVINEIFIPDACVALLEQERLGTLVIHRYHELSEGMLNWIWNVEADGIRNPNLLNTPGPMADYYQEHYPESWAIVEREQEDAHE